MIDFEREFIERGVIWERTDKSDPHPILSLKLSADGTYSSIAHSDKYVNCRELYHNRNNHEFLLRQVLPKLKENIEETLIRRGEKIDYIVSPESAGIFLLALGVALRCDIVQVKMSQPDDKGKIHAVLKEDINVGCTSLIFDDVITGGTAADICARVMTDSGARVVDFFASIANRAGSVVKNRSVISVVETKGTIWKLDEEPCELCEAGSPALEPKSNWGIFLGG